MAFDSLHELHPVAFMYKLLAESERHGAAESLWSADRAAVSVRTRGLRKYKNSTCVLRDCTTNI
jgi:hypothetical protein